MEVPHHHNGKEKKKLREYFYEFFMLFIAVTAGFYAENIREKFVERHKEHEYMQSMVTDLKQDLVNLNSAAEELKPFKDGMDSLGQACHSKELNDSVQRLIYVLNLQYLRLVPVTFSDRTSSQLKNSGSLRLIRNRQVLDSILNYWQQIDYFNFVASRHENFRIKARELSFKIFDYGLYNVDRGFSRYTMSTSRPQLLPNGNAFLSEYANYIRAGRSSLVLYYYPPVKKLQSQAVELIRLIKKEYELEE